MQITDNEKALLLSIRDSEYQEYSKDILESGLSPVWVDCLWGFEGKKLFGGVMASLTKKKLAGTDGECAWLTKEGLALIVDIPYKCTIDRASEEEKEEVR